MCRCAGSGRCVGMLMDGMCVGMLIDGLCVGLIGEEGYCVVFRVASRPMCVCVSPL